MPTEHAAPADGAFVAPYIGSRQMPRWDTGDLIPAPVWTWRKWFALLGPGVILGGASIGGGEWLAGPATTARYGGALMWLATLSIVGQVFYNIEISRYTLYSGEPIFTGKFRTLPGPHFWVLVYLLLDFGSVFPYLAANAATPLAALILGELPNPELNPDHKLLLKGLAYVVFFVAMVPILVGGKIYQSLKVVMTAKIIFVLGFLLVVTFCFTRLDTWKEIGLGFLRFGTVPIERGEDLNGNGVLDPGEDWDGDGRLDAMEPWIDADKDGRFDPHKDQWTDVDGDGIRDGDNVENIFVSLATGKRFPEINFGMIAWLAAFAAIAGSGGLTNSPISNYTRDQGWGMGYHVGAIPSAIGGQNIELSHVGMVFPVTPESLKRWKGWYRHVMRDQLAVWMPACFLGIALPSMLSVQFLPRGTIASDWVAAGMTAGGVQDHVAGVWGTWWGQLFWFLTILCGLLVLGPTIATTADGVIRRWVDVFWTSSARLREWDPRHIKRLYFGVFAGYVCFSMVMLAFPAPANLLKITANFYNWALGVSCWHTLIVNLVLLPRELRPGWFMRTGLALGGTFFLGIAFLQTASALGWFK